MTIPHLQRQSPLFTDIMVRWSPDDCAWRSSVTTEENIKTQETLKCSSAQTTC